MSGLDSDIADAAWQVVHREGILDELPNIRIPVSVLAGAEDHAYDVLLSQQIHELTPDSTMTVVARVGHSVALEDPETTNRHITELIERAAVGQT
ncbi:MAG: 3-oxoadipate enol-lactonase, partial [Actinomycetota bacterium]|nr:3-oxoadipate enol-lactonase [Actinomycetota bacterium]